MLERLLTRLQIRGRLIICYSVLIIASISLCGIGVYSLARNTMEDNIEQELRNTTTTMSNMVQAAVDVSVRNHLRAVAEKNDEIVAALYGQYKDGILSEERAKALARTVLLSQVIGKTGYIYCVDSKGKVVVHPQAGVLGRDISEYDFIRTQTTRKSGFLEYQWANPGEKMPRAKVLYMTYFKPWDWIISVSAYRSEFNYLVDAGDFRDRVEAINLGRTGYVFIIGPAGTILVHPRLAGNVADYDGDPRYGWLSDIYRLGSGRLVRSWKGGDEPRAHESIAVFDRLKDLGWTVAATMHTDEVYEPLNRLVSVLVLTVGLTLLLALPLSAGIARTITRPVGHLVKLFGQAKDGDLQVRSDYDAPDEIGYLSRRFNDFMDQLNQLNVDLDTETEVRRQAEYQRRLFEEVFNNSLEGILITDAHGTIVAANPGFTAITGFSVEEALGNNPRMLKSNRHDRAFYVDMWERLHHDGYWAGEIWNRRKNGESYPELLSISAIRGKGGETTHYVSVFHDITEMKSKEEQLSFQANHDALTGLPNRTLLMDRIATAIAHARREGTRIGLLFVDIDNFKHVNDSLDHSEGDALLQEVARRFLKLFREQDTISRLGGDEFVVMLEDYGDERQLVDFANRVLGLFTEPFRHKGHELYLTASLGVSVYPDDGADAPTLIKNADMAMYQAKESGKNKYYMFRKEMHERVERRLQIENALRNAVKQQEFVVYYQPKVDLETGAVVGLEALVRWILDSGEVVSPGEFIPLAEETGLIVDIGRQVMEDAFRSQALIREQTGHDLKISVNLSVRQFQEQDLMDTIRQVLAETGADPGRLEFEITESILMHDMRVMVDMLARISALGFGVSVDDFGTGYSSLAYLKHFPIDTLKVDRSFVIDIEKSEDAAQIVRAVITMSASLGLDVVAEGVETEEQMAMLRGYGCAKGQGFLWARPMPMNELLVFLKGT